MKLLLAILALSASLALAPVCAQELGYSRPSVIGIVPTDAGGVIYYSDGSEVAVEVSPDVYTASWISGGIPVSVKTYKHDGESSPAWAARFRCEVDALKTVFPPDPKPHPQTGGRI